MQLSYFRWQSEALFKATQPSYHVRTAPQMHLRHIEAVSTNTPTAEDTGSQAVTAVRAQAKTEATAAPCTCIKAR